MRIGPRLLIGALVCLSVVGTGAGMSAPVVAGAQMGQQVAGFEDTQAWIRLAKAHQIGEMDDALTTLAGWSPARLDQIDRDARLIRALVNAAASGATRARLDGRQLLLNDLASVLDLQSSALLEAGRPLDPYVVAKSDGPARLAIARVLLQAAMLHVDLMTEMPKAAAAAFSSMSRSSSGSAATTLVDGERRSVPDLGVHWDIAREAIDVAALTPIGPTIVRDWYRATGEYLLAHRDYAAAVPHLERGLRLFPDDVRIAFCLGVAYENLAAPAVQAAFEEGGSLKAGSRTTLLEKAELHLRRAAGDPEAALHLGRVLQVTGRDAEALSHLDQIETKLPDPRLRYYAALFAGRSQEAVGRDDQARAAFGRARDLYPSAQSPRIALAALDWRHRAGQAEAMALMRSLTPPLVRDLTADPWWAYDVSLADNLDAHMDDLRETIVRFLNS